jgi:hypothetical protein
MKDVKEACFWRKRVVDGQFCSEEIYPTTLKGTKDTRNLVKIGEKIPRKKHTHVGVAGEYRARQCNIGSCP